MATSLRVPFFRPAITEDDVERVAAALRSGWLTSGPRVAELERAVSAIAGAEHAVATASGTAAIHVALAALGIGHGDIVLVPTLTFVGTADPVRWLGARPVMFDCDPAHLGPSMESIRRTLDAIDRGEPVAGSLPPHGKVQAIVPMHFGGLAGDASGLAALADERGIAVVDDCAHALTAAMRDENGDWRHPGHFARASCFSFYANKEVTSGEGGMMTTRDGELAVRIRRLALHGIEKPSDDGRSGYGPSDYRVAVDGLKCNMSDLAAALAVGQIERAEKLREARAGIAKRYLERLAPLDSLALPEEPQGRRHAWHLFVVRLTGGRWNIDRDRLARELRSRGIETSVHYRPLHLQPSYAAKPEYAAARFDEADRIWPQLLSLPIYPGLTGDETEAVIASLLDANEKFGA